MTALKLMTFNVENMLVRYRFRQYEEERLATLLEFDSDERRAELIRTHWNVIQDETRVFTALSILDADPDVICLQEVENMQALRAFHDRYLRRLSGRDFPHQVLIESHDPRGIDVAVLSRFRITSVVTHQDLTPADVGVPGLTNADGSERRWVFSRDCLEVHVKKQNRVLPIFVCHFKSMTEGRQKTRPIREAEAAGVRKILDDRFNKKPDEHPWAVVGDLNDYTEMDGQPDPGHGLGKLLDGGFALDVVKARVGDPLDRWTHFYAGDRQYRQLDYVLLSPALADENEDAEVRIVRGGQPYRAEHYKGPRWPRVGYDRPKASDHCPLCVKLRF